MKSRSTDSPRYKVMALAGKALIRLVEFFISRSVKNEIYFPNEQFNWISQVERLYPFIKQEYLSFMDSSYKAFDICKISEEQYKVVEEKQWDFIPLHSYGKEISEFTELFPKTKEALSYIPDLTTAFFSILKPGAFIKEHRGAYKGYLRYQLGIQVPHPPELCAIQISGIVYHWKEGSSIVFDDTYQHSAWNHSSEDRVVLYVDFIRPMNLPLRLISIWLTKAIHRSPFIQNALRNLEKELSALKETGV